MNNKICIICKTHGPFWQTPAHHIHRAHGCQKCKFEKLHQMFSKGKEQFISDARRIHGDTYDYSKVEYYNSFTVVEIICSIHGPFWQLPTNHLDRGQGCNKCKGGVVDTKEDFIEKATEVHGDAYDYSEVEYSNSQTKVKIVCLNHGVFEQTPNTHLMGSGCSPCGILKCKEKLSSTKEDFVLAATAVHGNTYDYGSVVYTNNNTKVSILCAVHGVFEQVPLSHLSGSGCPQCGKGKISEISQRWLDNASVTREDREVLLTCFDKKLRVDGLDPVTNTIYEFLGDFWHGNPNVHDQDDVHPVTKKTFGQLFDETIERLFLLRRSGYNLNVIWEEDFRKGAVP